MICALHGWEGPDILCPWPDCENGAPQSKNLIQRNSLYGRVSAGIGKFTWKLLYRERDGGTDGSAIVEYTAKRIKEA